MVSPMTTYDAPDPLNTFRDSGISVVDPVTLRLIPDSRPEARRLRSLAGTVPAALARLGSVEQWREGTVASLDLSALEWANPSHPEEFISYRGEIRYSCRVEDSRVQLIDGRPLAALPMVTPGGTPVTLWMHEITEEPARDLCAYELIRWARDLLDQWESPRVTDVSVPVQGFTGGVEIFGLGEPVRQEITVLLRPATPGATWSPPVDTVTLGGSGPVLGWFTEEGADLPCGVFITGSGQWERPGDEPQPGRGDHDRDLYARHHDVAEVRAAAEWVTTGDCAEWLWATTSHEIPDVVWDGVMAAHYLAGPDFGYPDTIGQIIDEPVGEASWRDLATWFTWQSRGEKWSMGHLRSEVGSGRLPALFARFLELWDASATSNAGTSAHG